MMLQVVGAVSLTLLASVAIPERLPRTQLPLSSPTAYSFHGDGHATNNLNCGAARGSGRTCYHTRSMLVHTTRRCSASG